MGMKINFLNFHALASCNNVMVSIIIIIGGNSSDVMKVMSMLSGAAASCSFQHGSAS